MTTPGGGVGRARHVGPGRHLRDVLAGRPVRAAAVAAQLGEAEVEDLHVAVARQHHVLGLEVAVDDAGGVRAGEALGQLAGDVEHLPGRERVLGADEVAQRRPVHELHDGEGQPRRLADLVDRDDVGVVEGGGRARLLGESAEAVRDRGEGLGQELDGDVAAEVEVPRAVDLAHAPRAQLVEELVPAEPHADHGWHGPFDDWRAGLRLRPGARQGQGKARDCAPGKRTGATASLVAPVPVSVFMPCQRRGTAGDPAAAPSGCMARDAGRGAVCLAGRPVGVRDGRPPAALPSLPSTPNLGTDPRSRKGKSAPPTPPCSIRRV